MAVQFDQNKACHQELKNIAKSEPEWLSLSLALFIGLAAGLVTSAGLRH